MDLTTRERKSAFFRSLVPGAEVQLASAQHGGRAEVIVSPVYPSTWVSVKLAATGQVVKVRTSSLRPRTSPSPRARSHAIVGKSDAAKRITASANLNGLPHGTHGSPRSRAVSLLTLMPDDDHRYDHDMEEDHEDEERSIGEKYNPQKYRRSESSRSLFRGDCMDPPRMKRVRARPVATAATAAGPSSAKAASPVMSLKPLRLANPGPPTSNESTRIARQVLDRLMSNRHAWPLLDNVPKNRLDGSLCVQHLTASFRCGLLDNLTKLRQGLDCGLYCNLTSLVRKLRLLFRHCSAQYHNDVELFDALMSLEDYLDDILVSALLPGEIFERFSAVTEQDTSLLQRFGGLA